MHPLGLCNNNDEEDLYEYGWVGVVKLEQPELDPKPCLTVLGKAKRAVQRGATAVIFDVSENPDAIDQLNQGSEDPLKRPVVYVKGADAIKLMNIVNKQKVARARIQHRPPRQPTEYFDMGIFLAFFVVVSLVCLILLVKIKLKQRRSQNSMNRLAVQALEKMETRKFKSKSKGHREGSCGALDTLGSSSTSDCAICLEKYIDGEELRVIPCTHRFHKKCVDPWLLQHHTCPHCRHSIIEPKGNPVPVCLESSNPAPGRQQRVILPVHYPGRVHRTSQIPAYPTRTSIDSHGNPITLLTVDRPGEQGLYPAPAPAPAYVRSYQPIHLDPTGSAHHCGLEHRAYSAAHALRRPKFGGRGFSKAACFSQYETMYQHYYFQGLSYPEQEGHPAAGGAAPKGPSRTFPTGGSLLFPTVVHVAPSSRLETGSTSSFGCYHGHRSVCSGYLADCPGSDSSSSSSSSSSGGGAGGGGGSSGPCHCSSSDSVVDCTEVSNQGVYGSCSTFRSSLSSDYDPFVYRSRSPGRSGAVLPEGAPREEPPASSLGDQLSDCSLEMNYSSNSSLEPRDPHSSTSEGGLEAPPAAPATGRRTWQGPRASAESPEPACPCCSEIQPSAPEPDPAAGTADDGGSPFPGLAPWGARGPGAEPRPGSAQGSYGVPPDHLHRTDGAKYEGLPCCFYEEKQVARGGGGYTEDYAVSVQYTLSDEAPPGCYPGPREPGRRIPIIPEDVDCEPGPPPGRQRPWTRSSWEGAPGTDPRQQHRGRAFPQPGRSEEEEEVETRTFLPNTTFVSQEAAAAAAATTKAAGSESHRLDRSPES
ncbi:E3 ubiquitin-protein ligase ZNRF3 [Ornithorhynchus anatinus]|nr:E3 ubiquitin-protein ligase ZNRF3 [Ornithorhynchus anatinus]